jgi:hypothetical protein
MDAVVRDGASVDVTPDAGMDAFDWSTADAFTPLRLTEFDPSPCAPVPPPRRRPRALPSDPTPRILWTRHIRDLGLEGYPNPGAIDRNGDLHFSTLFAQLRGAEMGVDGTLLGYGFGFDRSDAMGMMTILPDDHAAEWAGEMIRIDASPPVLDTIRAIDFRDPGGPPADPTRIAELAATSDGLYAFRSSGGGRLRKFCLDGRLQWELAGLYGGGMRVDVDDSIWIPASDGISLHIDRHGGVLETVYGSIQFAGESRWVGTLDPEEAMITWVRSVDGVEQFRLTAPSDRSLSPDPTGAYWLLVGDPPRATRFIDGVELTSRPLPDSIYGASAADGSWLRWRSGDLVTVSRELPNGTVAWELELPGPIRSFTHDVDGRVYVYGSDHITAIQTDVLPPNVRGCWQYRCNPLANLSIVPLPE